MRLSRYLFAMVVFLAAVAGLAVFLIARLESAFLANPLLNAVQVAVWLIGIAYIFIQTLRLSPEIRWVQSVRRSRHAVNELDTPPLMRSLARLMEDRNTPLMLTPTALRAVLDGIAVRLDESRETARYFISLMIFLGLLGTFWGLLRTVGSVGGVLSGLSVTADPTELFANLKAGLQGPLSGMGTAFGSSLLGLAGSLVLGFLDLQMGQAQNRFFIDLEDWLFASTRGGDRALSDEAPPGATLQTLIEQTVRNIEAFHQIVAHAEEGRRQSAAAIQTLAHHVGLLAEAQQRSQEAMSRATDADTLLLRLLARLDQSLTQGELGGAATREHLQAIEGLLRVIAEEQAQARAQSREEIRTELRRLARTIGVTIDDRAG